MCIPWKEAKAMVYIAQAREDSAFVSKHSQSQERRHKLRALVNTKGLKSVPHWLYVSLASPKLGKGTIIFKTLWKSRMLSMQTTDHIPMRLWLKILLEPGGCSLVIEGLAGMCEALGLNLYTEKQNSPGLCGKSVIFWNSFLKFFLFLSFPPRMCYARSQ